MNVLALVVCAVVAVVLGILWYGPLFGKPWRREMGVTDEEVERARKDPAFQKEMMRNGLFAAVGAFVTAVVLHRLIQLGSAAGQLTPLQAGVHVAFWSWAGFAAPVLLGAVLWEKKTWKWWLITSSYYLVSWILMSVILSLWG